MRTGSKAGALPQEGGERKLFSVSMHATPHVSRFGKKDGKGIPADRTGHSTLSTTPHPHFIECTDCSKAVGSPCVNRLSTESLLHGQYEMKH